MNTKIDLPFQIGAKVWVVRKQFYVKEMRRLYFKKTENYEEYTTQPIYGERWVISEHYLKGYTIDTDGLMFEFCEDADLLEFAFELYDNDGYLFSSEQEANEKLKELQ